MKKKLKDVCIFYSGTGFPIKYQGDSYGDLPFYKVGDIANNAMIGNSFLDTCKNYISYDIAKKIKGTVVPKNVIVFAKIGEALKLNRRCITSSNCLIDNNVMGIGCNEKYLDLKYFYFFMKNLKMEKLAESTTVPSVRKTKLEEVFIEVPAKKLQLDISKILGILQDIILHRQNQLVHMDNLVKARFIEMFGDPVTNDKKLPTLMGQDFFKLSNGKFIPESKRFDIGIPAYGGNGISWYTDDVLCQNDTIVIGRVGFQSGNVHLAYGPMWITDNAMFISSHKKKEYDLVFLYYLMDMIDFSRFQDAGDLKKITQKPFMSFEYIHPELTRQQTFATFAAQTDKSKFLTLHRHKSIYTKPQLCCKMVIVNDFLNTKRFWINKTLRIFSPR